MLQRGQRLEIPLEQAFAYRLRVRGMPLRWLGSLAHSAFVRRDLEQLFDYRRDAIAAQLALPT